MIKASRKFLALPIGLALVMIPNVAQAATIDEISELLFQETTEVLAIEIADADLAESLADDFEYAIEEEVVDPEIIDEINDAIDSEREADLEELLDENSGQQEQSWLEKSPELLNAFDLVKFEFHQCRSESTGGARECAQGLGFKLQVASVQLGLADLEEQRAALDGLEGAELDEAFARISAQEAELERKLARAEEKLSRLGETMEGSAELQAVVTEARDAGISADVIGNQRSPGNPGNGNQGNSDQEDEGNQGEQGNGNQGNSDRGNQGNSDRGNQGNSDRGNQGNSDRGNQGNGNQGGRGNG